MSSTLPALKQQLTLLGSLLHIPKEMIVALSDAATTAPDSWTGPMEVINLSLNLYLLPYQEEIA
jgi:hypothetical protein